MALIDSLVEHWRFDEASGSAVGAHASINLSEDNGTVGTAAGKIGSARDFESGTGHFQHADSADFDTGDIDFTWAGWLNVESFAGSDTAVLTKQDVTNGEYELLIDRNDNKIMFTVYGAAAYSSGSTAKFATALSLATWHFIVAWHNSASNTINIQVDNGTVDSTAHSTGVYVGTSSFRFGSGTARAYYDGMADSWSLWKRILTSVERSKLYNGGAGLAFEYWDAKVFLPGLLAVS